MNCLNCTLHSLWILKLHYSTALSSYILLILGKKHDLLLNLFLEERAQIPQVYKYFDKDQLETTMFNFLICKIVFTDDTLLKRL